MGPRSRVELGKAVPASCLSAFTLLLLHLGCVFCFTSWNMANGVGAD